MRRLALAAVAVLVLAGCEDPNEADQRRFRETVRRSCPHGAADAKLDSRDDGPDITIRCAP